MKEKTVDFLNLSPLYELEKLKRIAQIDGNELRMDGSIPGVQFFELEHEIHELNGKCVIGKIKIKATKKLGKTLIDNIWDYIQGRLNSAEIDKNQPEGKYMINDEHSGLMLIKKVKKSEMKLLCEVEQTERWGKPESVGIYEYQNKIYYHYINASYKEIVEKTIFDENMNIYNYKREITEKEKSENYRYLYQKDKYDKNFVTIPKSKDQYQLLKIANIKNALPIVYNQPKTLTPNTIISSNISNENYKILSQFEGILYEVETEEGTVLPVWVGSEYKVVNEKMSVEKNLLVINYHWDGYEFTKKITKNFYIVDDKDETSESNEYKIFVDINRKMFEEYRSYGEHEVENLRNPLARIIKQINLGVNEEYILMIIGYIMLQENPEELYAKFLEIENDKKSYEFLFQKHLVTMEDINKMLQV